MRIEMEDMTPDKIIAALLLLDGSVAEALENSAGVEAQILPYQAAALYEEKAATYSRMVEDYRNRLSGREVRTLSQEG